MDDEHSTLKEASCASTGSSSSSGTHWTVVSLAGKGSSPEARAAVGELYASYKPALLAYLLYAGNGQDKAMDLLNGFFEHLLETNGLSGVERGGKFRNWLLRSLKNYITEQWRKQQAMKRGGNKAHLAIGPDFEEGEVEPIDPQLSPEQAYDRKWAIALLGRVLSQLEQEYARDGKRKLFDHLKIFLLGKDDDQMGYTRIGEVLGMEPNTVARNVKRMRESYARLLRAEISNTVDSGMIEEEWRHLQAALRGQNGLAGNQSGI
jgi:RNA polymerase sigma-70 factor (ECF subfamily)